jgi:hypothetical protein
MASSGAKRVLLVLLAFGMVLVAIFTLGRNTAPSKPIDDNKETPPPVSPLPEKGDRQTGAPPVAWSDNFQTGTLDLQRWTVISAGDFKERVVDVRDTEKLGPSDFRLRLRADTLGTDDQTVKFLGVRASEKINLSDALISADLDWNEQANGCYLSAAVILAPEVSSEIPLAGTDWLKIEYLGVPPGQNGRLALAVKDGGRERFLFTEGWPQENRAGRKLSVQKIELTLRSGVIEFRENGKLLYESKTPVLNFASGWLYLQMSSHSNYPAREVFFDNLHVAAKP